MRTWTTTLLAGLMTLAPLAIVGLSGCGDDDSGGFASGKEVAVEVTPNPISFGSVIVGAHAEQSVTIRHSGTNGTLILRDIRLDSRSTDITLTLPEETRLAVNESVRVIVNYDPSDGVPDTGDLIIDTNAPTGAGGALTVTVPILTLTQSGILLAIPNPVDFGDIEGGGTRVETVTVVNTGSNAVTITDLVVKPGTDRDFELTKTVDLPLTLEPDANFAVEVTYTPTNGGADSGRLDVTFEVEGEVRTINPPIELVGREVGPALVAFPVPVDFGWRPIGVEATIPVTIANQGARPLVLTQAVLSGDSSPTVTFSGIAGTETLAPQAVQTINIHFTPTADMLQTTSAIAGLELHSNSGSGGTIQTIDIFGRAEVAVLQVNPPSVDFGYVAQNLTTQREVTLYNAGSADLNVTSIVLADNASGEYVIREDAGFGPLAASPVADVIPAGEPRIVRITFTNQGAPNGAETGKLIINSDDGQQPMWEVDLRALRAGAPTCEIQLVPNQLDFGIVPRGNKKTLTANLVNVGSGDCGWHSGLANECASFFGISGCDDPNNTIQTDGTSDVYEITGHPIAVQNGLKAGQSYPVEVTFTPPETAPIFGDEITDYAGFLGLRIIDPYSGTTTPSVFPGPGAGGAFAANLHARSGLAALAVLPQAVDFGLITIGCHSQTITVTAYNIGTAPLDISNIQLKGCSPEFQVKAQPGLPAVLNPDDSLEVDVVYVPQDQGADSCVLEFYDGGDTPAVVVPLDGGGTTETEHTDEFIQTTGQDVDILFVVDSSGSMSDEQNNLSSNFSSFISGASTWMNDYHVAVTTMDMESEAGRMVGPPRFVDTQSVGSFAGSVRVGSNGSGTEQGLAAAQAALSLPLAADSGIACSVDTDCGDPERCWDGFCGGPNRGFLRADAALEIVFVSDEEDGSPSELNFYVNFFKNIKGFYNENLMHAHAIVGPPGGCNSSVGSAAHGARYIHVANETGGSVVSVCDPSFASGLASIGDIAFGLRTQFFLSRLADAASVEVTVNGGLCNSGGGSNWRYDGPSNTVIFNEDGSCMPQAGQTISIYYETLCLLE